MGLALGMGVFGCGDDDVPGLGGESGSTEEPRRVSGAEAQAIAEAISIEGADIVRKALPEPSDDPATPSVRSLPKRDIGLAKSRLDLDFQAESREGGGELRGAYLQLEGADFYWDIPKRSLKQNAVTATDDLTVGLDLPDVSPGIEFCFTVCVYSSEDLVSRPQTTCITVPNLGEQQNKDIKAICDGLEACDLAPTDCVEDLTRDVASIQAFADGCGDTVADTTSCVAGAADDCEFLESVFGGGDTTAPGSDGSDTGATGGTSGETGGEPTGSATGGTSSTGGADTGGETTAGDDTLDGGVGGLTGPARSLTSGVAKQNAGTCEKELTAFAECVEASESGASAPRGGTSGSDTGGTMSGGTSGADTGGDVDGTTGGTSTTGGISTTGGTSTTGGDSDGDGGAGGTGQVGLPTDGGGFVDPCTSAAVADYQLALDAYLQAISDAETTTCTEFCSVEMPQIGGCYIVSDGTTVDGIVAAHADFTAAGNALTDEESTCVTPPGGVSVCNTQPVCFQGTCTTSLQF